MNEATATATATATSDDAGVMAKIIALSVWATAVLLFIALLAQAPHAAEVFFRIAPAAVGWEFYLAVAGAILYAIALESATAYFVWKEETKLAWIFAFVSVVHNLCYYAPEGPINTWLEVMTVRYIASALLVSFSLPVAIAAFSHVQATAKKTSATTDATATTATANDTATATPQEQTAIAEEEEAELDVTTMSDTELRTVKTTVRKQTATRNRNTATADSKMTKERRRMHIAESGNFDVDAVMAQYGVGKRTAEGDIAEARKLYRNEEIAVAEIAVQLPQLAIATTNGFGAH